MAKTAPSNRPSPWCYPQRKQHRVPHPSIRPSDVSMVHQQQFMATSWEWMSMTYIFDGYRYILWHLSIYTYIYSMTYYMTNIVDGRCGCNWLRFMIFCDVCWNLAQSSQLKSALQAQLGTRMFSNRFLSSSIVRSNLEISSWPSMQNHIMNSWRPSSSSSPTIHWGIDH